MSAKNVGPVLFTQQDIVTVYGGPPPAPSPFGVRVGTLAGAINGTIITASTSPPDLPAGRPPDFIQQTPWSPQSI
ncbi:MAG: hypothetical protein LC802_00905 [Acidobacteria bacterium]|nr:hypothetical protein [Acidobacteriota bacterium]